MADEFRITTNRASTGRLGSLSQTGNLDPALAAPEPATIDSSTVKKAKTDTLSLSGDAAQSAAPLVSNNVKDLAKTIGAVQNEQKSVTDLQARINGLVPGGVKFDTQSGANWSSTELKNLLEVVEGMSPTDRQTLSGLNFVRAGKVDGAADGSAAVGDKMGKDVGEVAKDGALATSGSTGGGHGFFGRIRDFVMHSAETMEGIPVLRYFGKALMSMFGQQAPERAIVFGNSGTLISKNVWAHEIGHQVQMVNRGWNPEKIAEFSKLSGWKEDYGNGKVYDADGVDNRTGQKLDFDQQILKSTRSDNFVSKYAMTSPVEDFAETYRVFTTDPKTLMAEAPDKFLYLNAQSQRFSASEVKGFAQQTGQDLGAVATELVLNSGLKQDTLNSILTVNGLNAERSAVLSDAASKLSGGDALSQAWAKLTTLAKDPATAQQALGDPAGALGDVWGKLSPDEQAVFKDPAFMRSQLTGLQQGFASTRSSADATTLELYRTGTSQLMNKLMNDAHFRQSLTSDPAKTLKDAGLADKLPPEAVEAFGNNPAAVKALTDEIGKMMDGASPGDKQKYADNLAKALPQLAPEHFAALAEALNNKQDPTYAAKEVRQALETGSVVYQGGGEPPFC